MAQYSLVSISYVYACVQYQTLILVFTVDISAYSCSLFVDSYVVFATYDLTLAIVELGSMHLMIRAQSYQECRHNYC